MTWDGVYYGSINREGCGGWHEMEFIMVVSIDKMWWMMTWDGVYYGSINREGCGGWHEMEFIMVVSIEKDVVDDMRWSLLW